MKYSGRVRETVKGFPEWNPQAETALFAEENRLSPSGTDLFFLCLSTRNPDFELNPSLNQSYQGTCILLLLYIPFCPKGFPPEAVQTSAEYAPLHRVLPESGGGFRGSW